MMRIGVRARRGYEVDDAEAADRAGVFGVLIEPGDYIESVVAAAAATATRFIRLVVRVRLGTDHPVTLAEDLAVLDNISAGRVVALLDTGDLSAAAAIEDVALLAAALSARPVRHAGARWRVPAQIGGHDGPDSVQVTPKPVQIEIPIWLAGRVGREVAVGRGLPYLATEMSDVDASRIVQPAVATVSGDTDTDRDLVNAWAEAGATHLLLGADDLGTAIPEIARYLIPEVAMPGFPRVVAEAMTPPAWPGTARYAEVS